MNKEKREQQMIGKAKAYAEEIYKDYSKGLDTKHKIAETIADFCAGWRAADNSRWISVKKRLPEENEEVFAYNAENEEVIACDYHHKMFNCWPEVFKESITYWMPKPEAPRKEDKQ